MKTSNQSIGSQMDFSKMNIRQKMSDFASDKSQSLGRSRKDSQYIQDAGDQEKDDQLVSFKSKLSRERDNSQDYNLNIEVPEQDQDLAYSKESYDDEENKYLSKKPPSRNKKKDKQLGFSTMSDKDKTDKFHDTYDENFKLKKNQTNLESHIKKLNTQLHRIENEYAYQKKGTGNQSEKVDKQNIQDVMELKEENKRLKEKLKAFASAHQDDSKVKKPHKAIGLDDPSKLTRDSQRVKDLLKMVDILKKQLHEAQENNQRLQGLMNSKVNMTSKDQNDKNQKIIGVQAKYEELNSHYEQQKKYLNQLRDKMSEINAELRDTREKLIQQQSESKTLQLRLRNAEEMTQDMKDLKSERDRFEEKLTQLSKSPFFKDHDQRVNQQSLITDLQQELTVTSTKTKNLSNDKQSLQIENDELKKLIQKVRDELQDKKDLCASQKVKLDQYDTQMAPFRALQTIKPELYTQALGEVRWLSEKPEWQNIPEIREALNIDPTRQDKEQIDVLKDQVKDLKQQNGELAAHLEKTETMLKTRIEIERDKDKLHKADLQNLQLQLQAAIKRATELTKMLEFQGGQAVEQGKVAQDSQGVQYGDTVSVFSGDEDFDEGNFMDLWVGYNTFEQQNLEMASQGKIQDARNMLSFLTADFYNHDTQHTNIAEGLIPNYNFQMSFKVQIDQFFVQYLETNAVRIDVYAAVGTDAIKLGTANIPLSDLIMENRSPDVSAVIKSKLYIYAKDDSQRVVCCLDYRIRMRKPIFETINWLREQRKLNVGEAKSIEEHKIVTRQRKMVIVIDKATGLPAKTTCFVYYSLEGQDFLTSTMPAPNPRWDDHRVIEINYSEQFVGNVKTTPLQFTVFDDAIQTNNDGSNDILGTCSIKITDLIYNRVINASLDIKSAEGNKVGNLYLKIFWLETEEKTNLRQTDSLISQTWEQDITMKIAQNLRKRGLGIQTAFNIFDRDENKIIDYDEFEQTIQNTLNIQFMENELRVFFSKLPQPLSLKNFEMVFKPYLFGDTQDPNGQKKQSKNQIQLKMQSQLNSSKIPKNQVENIKYKIQSMLEKKFALQVQLSDLYNEIDANEDGNVGIIELKSWLYRHNLDENDENLYQFLLLCDVNRNKKVSLIEFFDFILEDKHEKQLIMLKRKKGIALHSGDGQMKSWKDQALISFTKERILEYMKSQKWSFYTMYKFLDKNQSGTLSKKELLDFLEVQTEIPMEPENIDTIFNYFDVDGNGKVLLDEFTSQLKQEAKQPGKKEKYRDLFKGERENLNQVTVQQVINGISLYMTRQNISLSDLFNELDKNNDGKLNRNDMRHLFQFKINVPIDEDKFLEFFDHFDIDKSNFISIKEFVKVLTPYLDKARQMGGNLKNIEMGKSMTINGREYSPAQLEQIKRRAYDAVVISGEKMLKLFKLQEVKNGIISQNDFKRIVTDVGCSLTNQELDIFVKHILQRNYQEDILYEDYLSAANPNYKSSVTRKGNVKMGYSQGRVAAKEIFEQIAAVLDKKKISLKSAFQKIDTDGDGKLDKQELRRAFKEMGLQQQATDSNLDEIIYACDIDDDGKMNYEEFIKILRQ